MPTITSENLLFTLTIVLVAGMANARPKIGRRFCANYPYAPRCLGVAAKRNTDSTQISRNVLPDYNNIETLLIPTNEGRQSNGNDVWDTSDVEETGQSRAVILPFNILSKIIDKKPRALQNQKRLDSVWAEYDEGRD